jgi:amino-acid N-acetyltransferase
VQVRPATADDAASILALLRRCALPVGGVPDELDLLLVAECEGRVAAVAGLELHPPDGLLRSVATVPEFRGRGLATSLCAAVERQARALGARRLYLLTETAEALFAKRGYRRVDRATAPAGIARSPQVAALCPASAILMARESSARD